MYLFLAAFDESEQPWYFDEAFCINYENKDCNFFYIYTDPQYNNNTTASNYDLIQSYYI